MFQENEEDGGRVKVGVTETPGLEKSTSKSGKGTLCGTHLSWLRRTQTKHMKWAVSQGPQYAHTSEQSGRVLSLLCVYLSSLIKRSFL